MLANFDWLVQRQKYGKRERERERWREREKGKTSENGDSLVLRTSI